MYAGDTHLTYAGDNADNILFRLNQDLENVKIDCQQTHSKYD